MADPRIKAPESRKNPISPLMQAKAQALSGEKVNACPFGCELEELDEHGYCRHLVGFTTDGKVLERQRLVGDRRQVFGNEKEPVRKGDVLVQITTSSRVYRADENVAKSA